MSKFKTCRELNIKPAYSSVDSLHPYDLDFAYVEWGVPLKSYDRGRPWQRQKLGYRKTFLVVSLSGDTCYMCRNWEAATELQQHLMEKEDA